MPTAIQTISCIHIYMRGILIAISEMDFIFPIVFSGIFCTVNEGDCRTGVELSSLKYML